MSAAPGGCGCGLRWPKLARALLAPAVCMCKCSCSERRESSYRTCTYILVPSKLVLQGQLKPAIAYLHTATPSPLSNFLTVSILSYW